MTRGRTAPDLHPDAYRALVEGAPVILYIDRPDELSTNLYTSPQIVDLLGFSVEEWMEDAELWVRRLHPDDRERVVREHRDSNGKGERFHEEYRFLAKDGREVWIRDDAVPVTVEALTVNLSTLTVEFAGTAPGRPTTRATPSTGSSRWTRVRSNWPLSRSTGQRTRASMDGRQCVMTSRHAVGVGAKK